MIQKEIEHESNVGRKPERETTTQDKRTDFEILLDIELAKAGINKAELAKRLGTSKQNINQKIKRDPKLSFIEEIAKALGKNVLIKFL